VPSGVYEMVYFKPDLKACATAAPGTGSHVLEVGQLPTVELALGPGVASFQMPVFKNASKRRHPPALRPGMQRPSGSALRCRFGVFPAFISNYQSRSSSSLHFSNSLIVCLRDYFWNVL
jgi:hypothetical protein